MLINKYKEILLLVILSLMFVSLSTSFIFNSAPTYDEGVHLTSGYSYWRTGKVFLNADNHPPFTERFAAIPLLFMDVSFFGRHPHFIRSSEYNFSDIFIYYNRVKAEKLINSGRFAILALGLLLGWLVFFWSKEFYGWKAGIFSFFILVFNPNIIANSSLVTTDIGFTLGFYASIFFIYMFLKKPGLLKGFLLGIFLGVCITSKFPGLIILPIISALFLYYFLKHKFNFIFPDTVKQLACMIIGFFAIAVFSYGFDELPVYFVGLNNTFRLMEQGRSTFLCGDYSIRGWWYYFIISFLIKNQIIFILLLLLILVKLIKTSVKTRSFLTDEVLFLLFPAVVYFFIASASKVHIGHRHILPIYPFIAVMMGSFINGFKTEKYRNFSIYSVVILYLSGTVFCTPNYLTYFNIFAGGSKNGYKYMIDSNLDWGQGLKNLGRYIKENNIGPIYLSYFGTADPNYYGIQYRPVGFVSTLTRKGNPVDISKEKRKIIAISATNLQANYYNDKSTFDYFRAQKPTKVIDHSILVYDITSDLKANVYLRELFRSVDDKDLVLMQEKIIKGIENEFMGSD
ncbi:MAG: glycosyltransferase family 39 protein [bacterium]